MTEHEPSSVDLKLLESEQRYRAVIDNASDMIQSVRPDGTFEFVNQAWHDKLGYTDDDLKNMIVWDIIHPDALDHCQVMFRQAISGDPINLIETIFVTKDGSAIPVEGNATSRMVGDTVIATHSFFRDVSERVRAHELERRNLQLEHEQQARYLEKMAALGKLSAGLAHELNNPAAAIQRASSRLASTIVERNASIRELLGTCNLNDALWQRLEELAERGAEHLDLGPLERDQREAEVEDWLDDHDVAESWKLAAGLVQAGTTIDDLNDLVSILPPMALAPALRWVDAANSIREATDIITRGSRRVSELVQAVKGYTYMDRGLEQEIDVNEGIETTLIILNHRLRDVTIRRRFDQDLPKIRAHGNTLNQVWTNLLDNAIDATDGRGTITITTRMDDGAIVVDIEDDGPGIPEEALTRIFEPFFTTKPQGVGTGLGLDTVWRLVTESHGGIVDVESRPGRTVFHVRLPITHESAPLST